MNEIESIIILRMDQIKHFHGSNRFDDIANTILVDRDTITKLDKRVEEINCEITEETRKKRSDLINPQNWFEFNFLIFRYQYVLMQQLKREFRGMTDELAMLKEISKKKMFDKFGMIINLDKMEESVLEHLLYDVKIDDTAIRKEYEQQSKTLKVYIL